MFFNEEENQYEGDVVPAGWHKVVVEYIELKPTKTGGSYFNAKFFIEKINRSFFGMFQWTHLTNADFQKRVRSEFSNFAWACGVTQAETEQDLISSITGKECFVKVAHKQNDGRLNEEIKDAVNLKKEHRKKKNMVVDEYVPSDKDDGLPF